MRRDERVDNQEQMRKRLIGVAERMRKKRIGVVEQRMQRVTGHHEVMNRQPHVHLLFEVLSRRGIGRHEAMSRRAIGRHEAMRRKSNGDRCPATS